MTETADYRCPDCGRESCTGEDCYWPGEAGIQRPARKEPVRVSPADETGRCDKALDTPSEVCPRCFRQHTWLVED